MTHLGLSVRVRKLSPEAKLPTYAHGGSLGDLAADLYSPTHFFLNPMARGVIPTGLQLEFPDNWGAVITGRSGLFVKSGLMVYTGTVDPGYRGALGIMVMNIGDNRLYISPGDRIAQIRFTPRYAADFIETTEELTASERGAGGFGSTGVNCT